MANGLCQGRMCIAPTQCWLALFHMVTPAGTQAGTVTALSVLHLCCKLKYVHGCCANIQCGARQHDSAYL